MSVCIGPNRPRRKSNTRHNRWSGTRIEMMLGVRNGGEEIERVAKKERREKTRVENESTTHHCVRWMKVERVDLLPFVLVLRHLRSFGPFLSFA